jgi:hypothetical protein
VTAHVLSGEVHGIVRPVFAYVHAIEGRLRIKVPEVKRSPARAREIERRFLAVEGIVEVSANPATGNVLFLYDPEKIGPYALMGALVTAGYMRDRTLLPVPRSGDAALPAPAVSMADTFATTLAQTLVRAVLRALGSFSLDLFGIVETLATAVAEFFFRAFFRQVAGVLA